MTEAEVKKFSQIRLRNGMTVLARKGQFFILSASGLAVELWRQYPQNRLGKWPCYALAGVE